MTMKIKNENLFWSGLLLLSGLFFISGCEKARKDEASSESKPLPLVRTMTIEGQLEREVRSFPIFAKEGRTAKLSFRVPGQLDQLDIKIGQEVNGDQILARLDQRDFKLAVARLDKGLQEARAGLKAMKTGARKEDIAALNSQLDGVNSRLEQAERQYKRMENLKKDGTVSDVQYDLAKATRDTLLSNRDSLDSQLKKAKAGARAEEIEMMEAKISGLLVDRALAENALVDTELKAPFRGTISEKYFDNHEMIAPGIPILSLVDTETIEATLSVPQDLVLQKARIEKILCRFETPSTRTFEATIKEIGKSVQQGNLAYPLTISLKIPEDAKGMILAGMTGTADILLRQDSDLCIIPSAAIIPESKDQSQTNVWIVDPETQTISSRTIEIGSFGPKGVFVKSGLKTGDIVVTAGARFLKKGQEVRIDKKED